MTLVAFNELMSAAERGGYAVGYFESWNLESLLAVLDAAEAQRSPVIVGFSGIYLPHPARVVSDPLEAYAALGLAACRRARVPTCLLFNECAQFDWVLRATQLGFNLVMFTDETLSYAEQVTRVRQVVQAAHAAGAAVEGEIAALPGVGRTLAALPDDLHLTDPALARDFVQTTGVDALAVNAGQAHVHGRMELGLDLDRIAALRASVSVPLALHGASSVRRSDLVEAIQIGVRKINVGSLLKRACFEAMRDAGGRIPADFNPYEVIGSGLADDVLVAGRLAIQQSASELMRLFGSAGKA